MNVSSRQMSRDLCLSYREFEFGLDHQNQLLFLPLSLGIECFLSTSSLKISIQKKFSSLKTFYFPYITLREYDGGVGPYVSVAP